MSKFRVGETIVPVKDYMAGIGLVREGTPLIILEIKMFYSGMYYSFDKEGFFTISVEDDHLFSFESVYNSPLYKALSEES